MTELPIDIWCNICYHLTNKDIFSLSLTNKNNHNKFLSNDIWLKKIKHKLILTNYELETDEILKQRFQKFGCFNKFREFKKNDLVTKEIINDLVNTGKCDDSVLIEFFQNFDKYIPSLLNERLHFVKGNSKKRLMQLKKIRSLKLDRIYYANKLVEYGNLFKLYNYLKKLKQEPDREMTITEIEEFYVNISLLDSNFYELIFEKNKFLNKIIKEYKRQELLENLDNKNANKFSKYLLLIEIYRNYFLNEKKRIHVNSDANLINNLNITESSRTNLGDRNRRHINDNKYCEDLSILRVYSGDSYGTCALRHVIIKYLIKKIGIEENEEDIKINRNLIEVFIPEYRKRIYFILNDDLLLEVRNDNEIPNNLKIFDESIRCQYMYNKFFNFFKSVVPRKEKFNLQHELVFNKQDINDDNLYILKGNYLYKDITGFFGYLNLNNWKFIKKLLIGDIDHTGYDNITNAFIESLGFKNSGERIDNTAKRESGAKNKFEKIQYNQFTIGDVVHLNTYNICGIIVNIHMKNDNPRYRSADQSKEKNKVMFEIYINGYEKFMVPEDALTFYKKDNEDETVPLLKMLMDDSVGEWFCRYETSRFILKPIDAE